MLEVIEVLAVTMKKHNVDYFIIGAMARDILLKQVYDIQDNTLVTQDIDFGVSLLNWKNYSSIEKTLVESGFTKDRILLHRFFYKNGFPIDIVPFGEIAQDGFIAWPPDQSKIMSVIGYDEAMESAITLSIKNSSVTIKMASLVGLLVLKLIAWEERYPARKKDAFDIRVILKNYISADNSERLYNDDYDLMEDTDFDYELSGARLLGRDVKEICQSVTLTKIKQILEEEMKSKVQDRLAYDMSIASFVFEDSLSLNQKMIKNLYLGIQDKE